MKLVISILLLISATSFAQKSNEVVAQVGKKTITLEDFNKKYNEVKSQTINPPTKEQFLEDLVRFEMGVQEAEKRNLQKDPVVQERFDQEMYKALLEKDIGQRIQKIQVSDAEMKAWYAKNPELRTSHILIEFKAGATAGQVAEAKKRATEIFDEVKKSKRPFEELVKLYSDDALSKQVGGDIGWQSRITLVPNYYDAVANMKVGEITGLIETKFGFHIIKLTGRRSFENANKRQIRAAVYDEKRKGVFNDYFEKLKKSYPIKENKGLIK
ncbi:peptidylprolyl isomerase [Bdellovibrio bacteriovorus]|uniref:peptidylprolyl isomerase n=1 Tax=Bdellovibrio bacteriovorus TaxID=959 RepID=UPI0021D32E32|nr:peptidylprolyl isomerase [Bdellovibrio bacteriovorus]UXR65722.1 peptidylprolyl isomerase [Bdellovibrio bacteriovorus]